MAARKSEVPGSSLGGGIFFFYQTDDGIESGVDELVKA